MPRNMSFAITKPQIRRRSKTVTRRCGWDELRPGERFWAVEKVRGLKKGERIKRIALLECVSNTRVRLNLIDQADVVREGFPELTPAAFVQMFCRHMKVKPTRTVNRIEFKYVRGSPKAANA